MIVLIHVLIAISSIVCATIGYARPTSSNLKVSYALIAATFTSGFFLVLSEPAHMLRACLSGVTYLAVVTAVVAMTRRKASLLQQAQTEI